MLLAFIPARGGSKGIPRKNLALLHGRPLIEYTIEAAQASHFVDRTLLSTDDAEIAAVGVRLGLDCSYRRPVELAADTTGMMESVEHGVRWYVQTWGVMPDELLLLQPTSPLRTARDIDDAVNLFRMSGAATLCSVSTMSEHPCECIAKTQSSWAYLRDRRNGAARRQDYEDGYYFINGAIYLAKTDVLLRDRQFIKEGSTALYVMPRDRCVDIDTPVDLAIAQALMAQSPRSDG